MLRHVVLCLGLALLLPTGSLAAEKSAPAVRAPTVDEIGYFRYVTSAAEAPARQRTTLVARCPVGTQPVGGGVRTTGESANDAVVTSAPFDSRDAGTRPDDGWIGVVVSGASDQLMVTSAVCAPFAVSYVTKSGHVGPRSDRRLTALCPSRLYPTGGGARTTGTARRIMLGETGATAEAGWRSRIENGSRHREAMTAYAICMRMPGDFARSGWSQRPAPPGVTTEFNGVTTCELNAQHVAGGGPLFLGSRSGHVLETSPADSADVDAIPDDGWVTKVYNETTGDLTLRSTRICLP